MFQNKQQKVLSLEIGKRLQELGVQSEEVDFDGVPILTAADLSEVLPQGIIFSILSKRKTHERHFGVGVGNLFQYLRGMERGRALEITKKLQQNPAHGDTLVDAMGEFLVSCIEVGLIDPKT